jgi:hypothetical protein
LRNSEAVFDVVDRARLADRFAPEAPFSIGAFTGMALFGSDKQLKNHQNIALAVVFSWCGSAL